jgi:hypothetical protein
MMGEVVGAFGSLSRLSEALEELYSKGIAPDRVCIATACAPPSSALPQSINDQSAATHWRSAEYAGHGGKFARLTTDSSQGLKALLAARLSDSTHQSLRAPIAGAPPKHRQR